MCTLYVDCEALVDIMKQLVSHLCEHYDIVCDITDITCVHDDVIGE